MGIMIQYLIIAVVCIAIALILLSPKSRNTPRAERRIPKSPEDDWDKTMLEERAKTRDVKI